MEYSVTRGALVGAWVGCFGALAYMLLWLVWFVAEGLPPTAARYGLQTALGGAAGATLVMLAVLFTLGFPVILGVAIAPAMTLGALTGAAVAAALRRLHPDTVRAALTTGTIIGVLLAVAWQLALRLLPREEWMRALGFGRVHYDPNAHVGLGTFFLVSILDRLTMWGQDALKLGPWMPLPALAHVVAGAWMGRFLLQRRSDRGCSDHVSASQ